MSHSDSAAFFGEGIPGVKFSTIGDAVAGRVIDVEMRQQTDMKSGAPQYWGDGRPKMQAVVTLEVMEPTDDDGGLRRLYIRGYMQAAFRETMKAKGFHNLTNGMWVAVRRTGTDETNGAYLYEAKVNAPGQPFTYALIQQDTSDPASTQAAPPATPF